MGFSFMWIQSHEPEDHYMMNPLYWWDD